MPSVAPTVAPSAEPSAIPSAVPSASPTVVPSPKPTTATPTPRPTVQPSVAPTAVPSRYPTGQPSGQPTAAPIRVGIAKTSRPTPVPSAAPTQSLSQKWSSRLTELTADFAALITSSSIVYADARADGTSTASYSTGCSDWNSFYTNVVLASATQELSSLVVVTTTSLQSSSVAAVSSCTSAGQLTAWQSAVSGSSATASTMTTCDGTTWKMGTCSGSFSMCFNCTGSVIQGVSVFAPCLARQSNQTCIGNALTTSDAEAKASYARIVIATFATIVAPTIESLRATAQQNAVVVTGVLGSAGALYCAAINDHTPSSVLEIVQAKTVVWAVEAGSVNVTISSLTASTAYVVYCVSMDSRGKAYSSLSNAIAKKVSVTTKCCKTVTVSLAAKSVFAGTQSAVGTLQLDSLPSRSLYIALSGVSPSSGASHNLFFPTDYAVSTASSVSVAFVGASSITGVYNVSVRLYGASASEYAVVFSNGHNVSLLASTAAPATPVLQYARFSSDGSYLTAAFDSATNRAGVASQSMFACTSLFSFTGASAAKCQWSSDSTTVSIYPNNALFPLMIGDSVQLLAGKLRAGCPSSFAASTCSAWPSATGKAVTVAVPATLKDPSVVLALPSSIGSCDNLHVDLGASTGNAGRSWSVVNISVSTTASNSSALRSYLASNSASNFVNPMVIPHYWLQKGYSFTITAQLCNFLGACSSATSSVSVVNVVQPFVSIVGGPSLTLTANSSLQLTSAAYVQACDGSKSTVNLAYAWSVSINNGTSSSAIAVVSKSRDPSKLVLASYVLTPLYSYTVSLTVTYSSSLVSTVASMTVHVPSSDLIVVIAGGTSQSVRLLSSFTVDASGSYDSDQADNGVVGVTFIWQCVETSPKYSSSCPLTLSHANTSILAAFAGPASANSTSALTLSMMDASTSRVASAEVVVTVLAAASAPIVSVVTTAQTVSTAQRFVLQGSVTTTSTCSSVWSVSDTSLNLTLISAVSPTRGLVGSTSRSTFSNLYLSINPNTLPAGSKLLFTLSCVDQTTLSKSLASVLISTNSPPSPGSVLVSPSVGGIALETAFKLSASGWVDSNTPLSYEFGFLAPTGGNNALVVQTKSQRSYAESILLPAGFSSSNYSVTLVYQIFDNLGASITQYLSVRVVPTATNSTSLLIRTKILMAAASGNVDGLKQVISTISSTLMSVNCTAAPNCTKLNRLDCSTTSNTCGSCVSADYIGVTGDSNDACTTISESKAIIGSSGPSSCTVDSQCDVWSTCNKAAGLCVKASKTCPSNCSVHLSQGQCKYTIAASKLPTSKCTLDDPSCLAGCVCSSGFFGSDCSFTAAELQVQQETTYELMVGLQQVHSLELLGSDAFLFRANALKALTGSGSSASISASAASLAYNMSFTLLEASTGSDVSVSTDVIDALASVVDSIAVIIPSTSDVTVSSLFDGLAASVSSQMVAGQSSQTYSQTNYRLTASVASSTTGSANLSVATPLTTLESLVGTVQQSLTVASPTEGTRFASLSVPKYLVNTSSSSSISGDDRNISANSFRINVFASSDASTSLADDSESIEFSFIHYEAESFGVEVDTSNSNSTINTTCIADVTETIMVSCPFDVLVPVSCDGLTTHVARTVCPSKSRVPSCSAFSSTNNGTDSCVVVNYTATSTTCRCKNSVFASQSTGRRRLSSDAATQGTQVVALTSYTFSEYVSVMESASSFNSAEALKDTVLIISTFAVTWIGMVGLLFGFQYWRWSRKLKKSEVHTAFKIGADDPKALGRPATASTAGNSSSAANSLEECLKEYVTELFSPTYSTNPDSVRLAHELWTKHEYLSVFALEFGYEQWIRVYSLLTNLNANFFLLALFYDIQFPSDDGICKLLTTESSCAERKSIFNPSEAKCQWVLLSSSETGDTYECEWRSVRITFFSSLVVFVIVLLVSAPICSILAWICENVLLAPSVDAIKAKNDATVAMSIMSNRRKVSVAEVNIETLQQQQQQHQAAEAKPRLSLLSSSGKNASQRGGVFSTVDEMHSSMRKITMRAQRLSMRSQQQKQSIVNAGHRTNTTSAAPIESPQLAIQRSSVDDEHFKIFDNFLRELRKFDLRKQPVSRLTKAYGADKYKSMVAEFVEIWQPLLDFEDDIGRGLRAHNDSRITGAGADQTGHMHAHSHAHTVAEEQILNEERVGVHGAATREFSRVIQSADSWIEKLKDKPIEQVGVQILELFVMDYLGANTREATIFSQKVHPLKSKYVITWNLKCFTFTCLFALNLYFVFACMLYGKDKGLNWQRGWLYTCIVNIVVDILINAVTVAAIMHFYVPNLIVGKARYIKMTVQRLIHQLYNAQEQLEMLSKKEHIQQMGTQHIFSPHNYFFVSAHVARAFPDLCESHIVSANTSFYLSEEQTLKINPSCLLYQHASIFANPNVFKLLSMFVSTMLTVFGSQSLEVTLAIYTN
jgi:histone H3/H4